METSTRQDDISLMDLSTEPSILAGMYDPYDDYSSPTKSIEITPLAVNDRIINLIQDLRTSISIFRKTRNVSNLNNVKDDINDLFYESNCKDILYTTNTDKMFFGLNVYPIMPLDDILSFLNGTKNYRTREYYVEIDSKLLDSSLTDTEIAACLVHDISALVVETPMKKVKEIIDLYLVNTNSVLAKTDSKRYLGLLAYAIRDCMRKLTSIFDTSDTHVPIKNEFMDAISMIHNEDIINKLKSEGKIATTAYETPIVILAWTLRLYNRILKYRVGAQDEIREAIKFTASELDRQELLSLQKRINLIDDDSVLNESVLADAMRDFKISGLKGYEEDYYEFKFSANNIETQDDALYLISQINSRMTVIADYLTTEKNIPSAQYKKWKTLLDNYNALRNEIASTKVRVSNTRLYVNYGFD